MYKVKAAYVILWVIQIQKYMRETSGINAENIGLIFKYLSSKNEVCFSFNIPLSILITYS